MASLVLCFSLVVTTAEGYYPAYEIAAVVGSTPSIDGVIASGEWDDASNVSFNNTVVYVKQDGRNLYMAFNVSDATATPTPPQDTVAIFIDIENRRKLDTRVFINYNHITVHDSRSACPSLRQQKIPKKTGTMLRCIPVQSNSGVKTFLCRTLTYQFLKLLVSTRIWDMPS